MKNASSVLATWWFDKLNDLGIVIGTRTVTAGDGIYDGMAPDTETGSYILVGERNAPQGPNKAGFTFDANILIDIVIKNGSFGYQTGDDIATQILASVDSDNQPDLSPDFQCVATQVSQYFNLPGLNNTTPSFRTLIRFRHLISQI